MIIPLTQSQADAANAAYASADYCSNCMDDSPGDARAVLADLFTGRAQDTLKKNCLSVKFLCRLCAKAIDQALAARRGS